MLQWWWSKHVSLTSCIHTLDSSHHTCILFQRCQNVYMGLLYKYKDFTYKYIDQIKSYNVYIPIFLLYESCIWLKICRQHLEVNRYTSQSWEICNPKIIMLIVFKISPNNNNLLSSAIQNKISNPIYHTVIFIWHNMCLWIKETFSKLNYFLTFCHTWGKLCWPFQIICTGFQKRHLRLIFN